MPTKKQMSVHRAGLISPPYISYRTFSGFIDGLRGHMPNRVDRSVMSSLSGSSQSQLMAALRYLDFISPGGLPTKKLSSLVNSGGEEGFQKAMREILVDSYPFLFKGFDLQKSTFDELTERFVSAGASGDTVRKCTAFFLSAAKHAGLQVSPFVTSRGRLRVRVSPRSRVESRQRELHQGTAERQTWRQMVLSKFPDFDASWSQELKEKWFDAFDKLMTWIESESRG